jgi:release factor glutamine methyltransferase
LYLQFERILTQTELAKYRNFVQRRAKFEPVQYITGEQEFMGLTFQVTPATLIPRPETELLVERAIEEINNIHVEHPLILDTGTGCGAIAISIAQSCGSCQLTAIDNSEAALKIARENAKRVGVAGIEFIVADGLSFKPAGSDRYHLIAANPPYISKKDYDLLHPQVKDYEPEQALLAGHSGIEFYEKFISHAQSILHPDGIILMEMGYDQVDEIKKLASQSEFQNFSFILDYQQKPRIVRISR